MLKGIESPSQPPKKSIELPLISADKFGNQSKKPSVSISEKRDLDSDKTGLKKRPDRNEVTFFQKGVV